MGVVVPLLGLLLLVASCSALFDGANVSPSNNPIVDKYHSSGDVHSHDFLEKNLAEHIVPGIVVGVILFTITLLYFTYRWCRACFCCCFTKCKKHHSHHHGGDEDGIFHKNRESRRGGGLDYEKRRQQLTHPVVSWMFRVVLMVFFLITASLIVIGLIGSREFHSTIIETLQTVDNTAVRINTTIGNTTVLLDNLVGVHGIRFPNDTANLVENGNKIVNQANELNTKGPHVDGLRDKSTMAVYFIVAVPMLLGLISAILAKGRLAFAMSVMLPVGLLLTWLLFSFHYAVFVVNVDACYAIDEFLTSPDYNSSSANSTNPNPLSYVFDCSSLDIVVPVINAIDNATNQTRAALANTTNPAYAEQLTNQITALNGAHNDMEGLKGCTALASLMFQVYPDLCGKSVQASLFLWQSEIVLGIVLILAFVLGVISEYRIGRQKTRDEGFNPLLSLNE